jgi:hypothetical protein
LGVFLARTRISAKVEQELQHGALWPEPLLQLNPTFRPGGLMEDLVADGTLHRECARIFPSCKFSSDRDQLKQYLV